MSRRILISGGGTGGHVFPAIAIADAIREIMPLADILFVGAEGKMEMDRVPKAGYQIEGLPIQGFHRKLTFRNLTFPFKLVNSMIKARAIVKRFKPDIAVGVGGYASGPVLNAAVRMGVPIVLQEQNSYAGVTNKILGKQASKVCVAYDNMGSFFPADKIIYTGNPVRKDIYENDIDKMSAKVIMELSGGNKTILIIGGSLGARTLNLAIKAGYDLIRQHPEVDIIWQVGKLYYEEYKETDVANLPNVRLMPFIDNMAAAYKAADIVVSRAGALSISELSLVGQAVILVPSPNVAEDHQTKNAMALVNAGAAELVKDIDAESNLVTTMLALLKNEEKCASLRTEIKRFGKPNAAQHIAKEVLSLIG